MTKPLSPAAQGVLDATFDHWPGGRNHPHKRACLAAALRAAADQVVPARPVLDSCCEHFEQAIRYKLLAIAAELKADGPAVPCGSEPASINRQVTVDSLPASERTGASAPDTKSTEATSK